MISSTRNEQNPLLRPNPSHIWESKGAFNPSIVKDDLGYHAVYRALSNRLSVLGNQLELSTVGYAFSSDGISFPETRQLIQPEYDWEQFGCEDPRMTKLDNEYFVFYTALSEYPFHAGGIKVALAIFSDLHQKPEKHLITPFNAKAMVLLPEKIQGKYAILVTVNTDLPPARIALALFDKKEDMWSEVYWREWYQNLASHVIPLQRMNSDQLEVGAVPVKTEYGWLLIYSHIQHYYLEHYRLFGVEAVMLASNDPQQLVARIDKPLLVPEELYEKEGNVSNIVFPTGAVLEGDSLRLYYGAADTSSCLTTYSFDELTKEMFTTATRVLKADKSPQNPIISPLYAHEWEERAVLNPAAYYDGSTIHIAYRAMSPDNTSVFGHAKTIDGETIIERGEMPMYVPRAPFEHKNNAGGNSGCEDPRITKLGDTLYLCYTAYDGVNPPRVALSTLSVDDFIHNEYNWTEPILISPPGIDDKDAALFPEKINGNYAIIHRIQNSIVLDYVDTLDFGGNTWLRSLAYIPPRGDSWDSEKIGLSAPPIKTAEGWLLLYHGVSRQSHEYRIGAMLLDLNDPSIVLSRTPWPILEPETQFERNGIVNNVVFPCSAIVVGETLFIYYGGADTVVCVATLRMAEFLRYMLDIKDKKFLR